MNARITATRVSDLKRVGVPVAALVLSTWLLACSGAYGPAVPAGGPARTRDAASDDLDAGLAQDAAAASPLDAGLSSRPDVDAFFIEDPAPPSCGPDGGMSEPPKIEGTLDCPADKNRQGCACPKAGMRAACWPGRRQNRNHGICKDGVTTCQDTDEFGLGWGPCEGYVLPREGVLQGPEACGCFSTGQWMLSNLVPCVQNDANGVFIYSSYPKDDSGSGFGCDGVSPSQPMAPVNDWSKSALQVACAGQFKLCYTMKAGRAATPKQDDCVLTRSCVDVWYEHAGARQDLPNLPSWIASDSACAKRFVDIGGYGEMSVIGLSAECEAVDDGNGAPYVFLRTAYCDSSCGASPDTEACKACSASSSGSF